MNTDNFRAKYGPWAIVTGASSGIGAEFCRQLAAMGMNLVMVARRQDRMQQLADTLMRECNIETRIVSADLTKEDFLASVIEMTKDLEIGLLVSSAGFANTGQFLNNSLADELDLLHVNCGGTLSMTHHFGNRMISKRNGGIILLSSVTAFSAVPQWSTYAATKAFILSFAEAISSELKEKNIDVLALCPGPTTSEFLQRANLKNACAMDVDIVVEKALSALGRKTYLVTGFVNKYNAFVSRFMPRAFNCWFSGMMLKRAKIAE